jgi:hypothetical protein
VSVFVPLYAEARRAGIRAARLPIREHMPGVTNQILSIDTALKVLCEKYEVGLYNITS